MAVIYSRYNYINELRLEDLFTVSPVRVASLSTRVSFLNDEERSSLIPKLESVKLQPPTIQFSVTTNAPTLEERNAAMAVLQRELFRSYEKANNFSRAASSTNLYLAELRFKSEVYPIRDAYFDGDFVVERGVDYARADLTFVIADYVPGVYRINPYASQSIKWAQPWAYFDIDYGGTAPAPLRLTIDFGFVATFPSPRVIKLAIVNTETTAPGANAPQLTATFRDIDSLRYIKLDTEQADISVGQSAITTLQPYQVSGVYGWLDPGFNRVFIGSPITYSGNTTVTYEYRERNF